MDQTNWVEWIGRASAATILGAIIVTGSMGLWVFGKTHEDMRSQRDEWKALALKGTALAESRRAIGTALPAPSSQATPAEIRRRLEAVSDARQQP